MLDFFKGENTARYPTSGVCLGGSQWGGEVNENSNCRAGNSNYKYSVSVSHLVSAASKLENYPITRAVLSPSGALGKVILWSPTKPFFVKLII